jgi:hypothetical protein
MSVVATLNSSTFYPQTSDFAGAMCIQGATDPLAALRLDHSANYAKSETIIASKKRSSQQALLPALKSGQWIISDAPESIKYSRTFLQVIIHPSIVISVNSPSSELSCGGGDLGEIKGPRSSAAEPSCSLLAPPSPWPERGLATVTAPDDPGLRPMSPQALRHKLDDGPHLRALRGAPGRRIVTTGVPLAT